MFRIFYVGVVASVLVIAGLLPQITSAFYFLPFIIPGGTQTVTETYVQNANYSFAYDTDYIRFTALPSYADAEKIANTLRYNPTVTTGSTLTVTGQDGYPVSVAGLTASQQSTVKGKIERLYEVVVSNYIDPSGLLRYQVQGNAYPSDSSGSKVTLSSSRLVAFLGQPFSLHWANTGSVTGDCSITAVGPTGLNLPTGSIVNTSGSATVSGMNTPGDYRVTYQCQFSSGTRQASIVIKAVESSVLP